MLQYNHILDRKLSEIVLSTRRNQENTEPVEIQMEFCVGKFSINDPMQSENCCKTAPFDPYVISVLNGYDIWIGNCWSFSVSEPNVYIYFTASKGNAQTVGINTPPEQSQEEQNVGKQMYTVPFDSIKVSFDTLEDLVEYNNECNISQLVVVNEDVSVMYANGTHTTRIGPSRNAWSCQLTNRCMYII